FPENIQIFVHLLLRQRQKRFPEFQDFILLRVHITARQAVDAAALLCKQLFNLRDLTFIHNRSFPSVSFFPARRFAHGGIFASAILSHSPPKHNGLRFISGSPAPYAEKPAAAAPASGFHCRSPASAWI